jgi:hypothetical protein
MLFITIVTLLGRTTINQFFCESHPPLDEFGHHLTCGCIAGKHRVNRHDMCA